MSLRNLIISTLFTVCQLILLMTYSVAQGEIQAFFRKADSLEEHSLKEAEVYLNQGTQLALAQQQYPSYVEGLSKQATLNFYLGNFDAVYALVDSAWFMAEAYLQPDQGPHRFAALNYFSIQAQSFNQFDLALERYTTLLRTPFTPQTQTELSVEGSLHTSTGTIYLDKKEYALAATHLKQGIFLLRKANVEPFELIIPYLNYGSMFIETNNLDSSGFYLNQALRMVKQYPIEEQETNYIDTYLNLSSYYFLLEQYDSALFYGEKAYQQYRAEEKSSGFRIPLILGAIHTQLGNFDTANALLTNLDQARVNTFGPSSPAYLAGQIQRQLGDAFTAAGQYEEAEAAYLKGLTYFNAKQNQPPFDSETGPTSYLTLYPERAARIWGALGKVHLLKQSPPDFSQSEYCYQVAISLMQEAIQFMSTNQSRAYLASDLNWLYEGYLGMLWEKDQAQPNPHNIEQGIILAEESRTQLMRLAMQDNWSKIRAGLPDSLLRKEQTIRYELVQAQQSLIQASRNSNTPKTTIDSLENLTFIFQNELISLIKTLEELYPRYIQLKYQSSRSSIPQQVQLLAEDQSDTWLSFWGKKYLYIFQEREGLWTWERREGEQIQPLVERIRSQALQLNPASVSPQTFQQLAFQLREMLRIDQDERPLILIPDGPLHFLPFECLSTDTTVVTDWSEIAYLGIQRPIHYQYSLTPLPDKRAKKQNQGAVWLGMAPSYEDLFKMQFNKTEITQISQLLDQTYYEGLKATKSLFVDQAPNYAWLHFAGHARADETFPLQSHLEFAPDSNRKLYAWEVYNLDLNADVVVLSGCETGAGRYQRGEGVMGLARAFRYAGVPNILQSLWLADGQATQNLMLRFYEAREAGQSLSNALQTARQQFLLDMPPRFHHPYYWANFILVGPDLEQEVTPWQAGWAFMTILFLLISGMWFWRKQAKQA